MMGLRRASYVLLSGKMIALQLKLLNLFQTNICSTMKMIQIHVVGCAVGTKSATGDFLITKISCLMDIIVLK